ncbi:hypothetical protein BaRGS_00020968, partial [Batillaria attramentaria]
GDSPAEQDWKWNSMSSVTCTSGRNVEITDAYYVNVTDRTLCDENCKATQTTASPSQCKIDGGQCRQKMDQDGLDSVYATCNAKLSHCDLRAVRLPERFVNSSVYVKYTCISETERVDPCRLPRQGTSTNASALLLNFCSSCNGTCEISPINKTKPISFKYSFLQKGSPEQDNGNIAEYQLVPNNESIELNWTALYRVNYTELRDLNGVQKVQLRFQISNPANMTRLWISFYDLDVSIACNGSQPQVNNTVCQTNSRETSTDTSETTSTDTSETTSTDASETTRRRQHRPEGTPKVENPEATSSNRTKTSVPSADDREYSECFPTASANTGHEKSSSAPGAGPVVALKTGSDAHCTVTCQPGSDPGEDYSLLQHGGGGASVKETPGGHSTYDHVGRGQADGDVYNVLQREAKKQDVVDNVYSPVASFNK